MLSGQEGGDEREQEWLDNTANVGRTKSTAARSNDKARRVAQNIISMTRFMKRLICRCVAK